MTKVACTSGRGCVYTRVTKVEVYFTSLAYACGEVLCGITTFGGINNLVAVPTTLRSV